LVLSVAFGLMIAFYISAEDFKKTTVEQTQTKIEKLQAQVSTVLFLQAEQKSKG
jgi:hypothetical protein